MSYQELLIDQPTIFNRTLFITTPDGNPYGSLRYHGFLRDAAVASSSEYQWNFIAKGFIKDTVDITNIQTGETQKEAYSRSLLAKAGAIELEDQSYLLIQKRSGFMRPKNYEWCDASGVPVIRYIKRGILRNRSKIEVSSDVAPEAARLLVPLGLFISVNTANNTAPVIAS